MINSAQKETMNLIILESQKILKNYLKLLRVAMVVRENSLILTVQVKKG